MKSITKWLAACAALAAIGTVAWVAMAPMAKAADLGGNCCADLEERIAELEATTARKGNRKVSLTISGVVHKGVLWHNGDDFPGSDKLSVYDGSTDPSRLRISGEAKIRSDWAAGFVIEIAYAGDQARGRDTGKALLSLGAPDSANELQIGERGSVIRHSFVYVTSPIGKVSVGQQSMATDGVIEVNLANTLVAGRPLSTMPLNVGGAISGLAVAYDGYRANALRYDTPSFGGMVGSIAWTDTESWDAALRWAGEAGGFQMAFGIGYRDQKSQTLLQVLNVLDAITFDVTGAHKATSASGSIKHVSTGLFATAFYSRLKYDIAGRIGILPPLFSVSFPLGSETMTGYGGQVGIERNWLGAGATTLFAEYQKMGGDTVMDEMTVYGIGVVQKVDHLGLDLYLAARRYEPSGSGICVICVETDVIAGGAVIRF